MSAADIGGLVLIGAGVIWFFLVGWGPPPRGIAAKGEQNPLLRLLDIIREQVNRLPQRYVPGAVLVLLGVLLLALPIGE